MCFRVFLEIRPPGFLGLLIFRVPAKSLALIAAKTGWRSASTMTKRHWNQEDGEKALEKIMAGDG